MRDATDAVIDSLVSELLLLPGRDEGSFPDDLGTADLRHISNCLQMAAASARTRHGQITDPTEAESSHLSLLAQYVTLWPAHLHSQETHAGMLLPLPVCTL